MDKKASREPNAGVGHVAEAKGPIAKPATTKRATEQRSLDERRRDATLRRLAKLVDLNKPDLVDLCLHWASSSSDNLSRSDLSRRSKGDLVAELVHYDMTGFFLNRGSWYKRPDEDS